MDRSCGVQNLLSIGEAVDVLERTLTEGYDPEQDGTRSRLGVPNGQLLQMPSGTREWCGTKLVTLRPGNENVGLPVIQGVYVLFEGETLRPIAVLDGASLTALRTPAVTALAVRHLTTRPSGRVTLFGTGVQALPHVEALRAVFTPEHISIVGRRTERVHAVVDEVNQMGIPASAGRPEEVAEADVVLCCTSASTPLFDGSLVQDHAVVCAIGSHDPSTREVDSELVRRANCVVESHTSAKAEAGDLIIPANEGVFDWAEAITLSELVTSRPELPSDRPRLFKGTGMPWQDLSVVSAIYLMDKESSHVR